jgi:quercetin dioxygenase-like cupin family protein
MEHHRLEQMIKGWFVGNFEPTVYRTNDVEVGVKTYPAGASEERHHHKVATEVTVVLSGRVRMNGIEYGSGAILVIPPGESTDFEALDATTTVVVKLPGANNDKYPGDA